jgi:rieske iron-sulfur protein
MGQTEKTAPIKSFQKPTRRMLIRWLLGAGAVGAAGAISAVAISIKPLERYAKQAAPIASGDRLLFAVGVAKGQVIQRESLQMNEATLAFPEGKEGNADNLIMVCHLDAAKLAPPTFLEWTVESLVAYSAICTHLGCATNFSQPQTQARDKESDKTEAVILPQLLCPCHGGVYDPHRGALVQAGPVPRPLPQLPIQFNDQGELIAAGWFNEPPGVVPKSELNRWRQQKKS